MNKTELINKINNNVDIEYGVLEKEIRFMGKEIIGLMFYLRNGNRDNVIENPYKAAIDLTKGYSVFDVTIVEFEECNAFTYYWEDNGVPRHGLEDFDKMARGNEDLIGGKYTDIFFTILPLEENHLLELSEKKNFQEIIEFIRYLPYCNPVRFKGPEIWDDADDNFEREDRAKVFMDLVINSGWEVNRNYGKWERVTLKQRKNILVEEDEDLPY